MAVFCSLPQTLRVFILPHLSFLLLTLSSSLQVPSNSGLVLVLLVLCCLTLEVGCSLETRVGSMHVGRGVPIDGLGQGTGISVGSGGKGAPFATTFECRGQIRALTLVITSQLERALALIWALGFYFHTEVNYISQDLNPLVIIVIFVYLLWCTSFSIFFLVFGPHPRDYS